MTREEPWYVLYTIYYRDRDGFSRHRLHYTKDEYSFENEAEWLASAVMQLLMQGAENIIVEKSLNGKYFVWQGADIWTETIG